ncbi:hypothetical protein E2C01_020156 [Portunus trituberculatus]|uniref:Uncharacterized protein n=1 Tax=Portunus trituberculatus TaxID=210409 RepID=A0A5B7E2E4_PORTR|nr:hypothetical protein [Portunus trituberculatus]
MQQCIGQRGMKGLRASELPTDHRDAQVTPTQQRSQERRGTRPSERPRGIRGCEMRLCLREATRINRSEGVEVLIPFITNTTLVVLLRGVGGRQASREGGREYRACVGDAASIYSTDRRSLVAAAAAAAVRPSVRPSLFFPHRHSSVLRPRGLSEQVIATANPRPAPSRPRPRAQTSPADPKTHESHSGKSSANVLQTNTSRPIPGSRISTGACVSR